MRQALVLAPTGLCGTAETPSIGVIKPGDRSALDLCPPGDAASIVRRVQWRRPAVGPSLATHCRGSLATPGCRDDAALTETNKPLS